ncbi:hypothetical protein Q3G72_026085 [Acer saccharum]|nr:hypothetical protein Q3G72_026085 [Acer saccharum]
MVEPDVMAYVTLIMGLCKGGEVERGYELFREMKEKGILIDRAIYRVLVDGFMGKGKVGKACDLLKDLMDSGSRADLGIYNYIIGGLCNVKHVYKAYKLFEVTVQDGLEPNFATVNPMLFVVGKEERIMMDLEVFEEIKGKGFSTAAIYKILMGAFHKIGDVQKALSLYGEMKDLNLELDSSTYSIAIQCFVENEDV